MNIFVLGLANYAEVNIFSYCHKIGDGDYLYSCSKVECALMFCLCLFLNDMSKKIGNEFKMETTGPNNFKIIYTKIKSSIILVYIILRGIGSTKCLWFTFNIYCCLVALC